MSGKSIANMIPAELSDIPIINMNGSRDITVDGFKGIEEYSDDSVSFRVSGGLMTVVGGELTIKYMSLHTIVIAGKIKRVEFL